MPVLIFTGGGNKRMTALALEAGYRYGARLPETVQAPLYFADQDWRKPDRAGYMAALARHRPDVATVLDWERPEQLPEVLDWAEEAAQYAGSIVLIPKVIGGIERLPQQVGSKQIILGYSVHSKFGGTWVPLWEFAGWSIHLLGGSPQRQMRHWLHFAPMAEVVSVDGNMTQKMANRHCAFWVPGNARQAKNRYWPQLQEVSQGTWGHDAIYEAFRRSCVNVRAAWHRLAGEEGA